MGDSKLRICLPLDLHSEVKEKNTMADIGCRLKAVMSSGSQFSAVVAHAGNLDTGEELQLDSLK